VKTRDQALAKEKPFASNENTWLFHGIGAWILVISLNRQERAMGARAMEMFSFTVYRWPSEATLMIVLSDRTTREGIE